MIKRIQQMFRISPLQSKQMKFTKYNDRINELLIARTNYYNEKTIMYKHIRYYSIFGLMIPGIVLYNNYPSNQKVPEFKIMHEFPEASEFKIAHKFPETVNEFKSMLDALKIAFPSKK